MTATRVIAARSERDAPEVGLNWTEVSWRGRFRCTLERSETGAEPLTLHSSPVQLRDSLLSRTGTVDRAARCFIAAASLRSFWLPAPS